MTTTLTREAIMTPVPSATRVLNALHNRAVAAMSRNDGDAIIRWGARYHALHAKLDRDQATCDCAGCESIRADEARTAELAALLAGDPS